ncbi:AraC family transcriptional regulator [Marinimicrobium sp. ABcell2]|uniref:helix-turn-helix domain-containing protein n=1 Tax=Marinimicrobium sp. ABcell2 TaxID=3069751 RepID=UPI0027B62A76|nr:helix-turn-helix domain-containing protein [Marinimicrobium sp. ABcell2]MDQ2076771.1 helix-turn-helix domain-containing protein [Marinimicrobium sp. ABcell2]
MLEFYKKALLVLLGLLIVSAFAAYLCVQRAFLQWPLLPADTSAIPWEAETESDRNRGGLSTVEIHDASYSLDFELFLSPAVDYAQASLSLVFKDQSGEPTLKDLASFDRLTFNVKCAPSNVLGFTVFTFDRQLTEPGDYFTYRAPSAYFSCSDQWREVEVDLTRLEMPQWWLDAFEIDLSMKGYDLAKVAKVMFGSTFQSPMETDSRVQVNELTLHGRDWRYMYLLAMLLLVAWAVFGVWLFRQHTKALVSDLRSKLHKDRPLVAYQQLSVEPKRDKDKDAILRFMATEYSNPDLNLEGMGAAIGVSRTKINDILKAELGFTFTGYLNKLRLTEAARLLAEAPEASVSEIAYSVGYKNVSYFNKLFKDEYSCTPRTFKSLYEKAPKDSES